MKKIYLVLIVFPIYGFSQKNSKRQKVPTNLNNVLYSIKTQAAKSPVDIIQLPFNSIEVLDARFDTSKIGFEFHRRTIDINHKDFRKIKLAGGTQNSIQQFYNDYYSPYFKDSSSKLLIVLKRFWVDNLPTRNYRDKKRYDIVRNSYQDIYVKVEYYLHKNNDYYPLKRIDTVFQLSEQNLQLYDTRLGIFNMAFFLHSLTCLIEKNNFPELINKATNRQIRSLQNIDSFNKKRFLLPILAATKINKGVFLHFKEFCNNSPVTNAFEINKYKKSLLVQTDTTGSLYFWAYSDDSGTHMSISGNSDLVRVENTFEFFVFDKIYLPRNTAGNLLVMGDGSREFTVFRPRQIDMETGDIY